MVHQTSSARTNVRLVACMPQRERVGEVLLVPALYFNPCGDSKRRGRWCPLQHHQL